MTDAEIDLIDANARDGEEMAVQGEMTQIVHGLIQTIPFERRVVLLMHDLEDIGISDIARELDIPEATAWDRLRRARKAFKASVERLRKQDPDALNISGVRVMPILWSEPDALLRFLDVDPPGIDDALEARLWERLQDSIRLPPDGPSADAAPAPVTHPPAASDAAALHAGQVAIGVGKLVGGGALLFMVGAGAGAAGMYALSSQTTPQSIAVVAVAPEEIAAVASSAPALPDPSTAPLASAAPAPSTAATGDPGAAPDAMDTDGALIQRAMASLGAGKPGEGLALLTRHAQRYPRSPRGQQREALTIQALAASGQRTEAAARAARFRQAYPHSVYFRPIEAALRPSTAAGPAAPAPAPAGPAQAPPTTAAPDAPRPTDGSAATTAPPRPFGPPAFP